MIMRYLFALLFLYTLSAQAQPLTVSITHVDLNCYESADGSASAMAANGTPPYTYLWLPSLQSTASISGLAAGTYTCIVSDAASDTAIGTVIISQPAALVTAQSQSNLFCNGAHNGIASVLVGGGSGPYNYSWAPSGGNGPNATGLSGGSYTCTVSDGHGCTTAVTFLITEPPPIDVFDAVVPTKCYGDSTGTIDLFVTGGTAPYDYVWAPNTDDTTASVSGLPAGTYTCTITDANFCHHTEVVSIASITQLAFTDSQANLLCYQDATGFASVTVSGGTPPYAYGWSPAVSAWSSAPDLQAGTYICTITDQHNCMTRDTFVITEPEKLKILRASKRNIICAGKIDAYVNAVATGGTPPYDYMWNPGAWGDTTFPNLNPGTYTCTVTDTNGCSCDTALTIVDTSGLFSYTASSFSVGCRSARLTATPDKGSLFGMQYTWYFSDLVETTGNPVVHTFPQDSPNTAMVVIVDSVGCTDTVSLNVSIHYDLYAAFTRDPDGPNPNKPTTFYNASFDYASRFYWDFGDGTSSTEENPQKIFYDSGLYYVCLVASDTNGCADTSCRDVLVDADKIIAVPSAFSPNGDGMNDVLYVRGFRIASFHMKIFNRFGELLFETTTKEKGWDGTWKGVEMPADAYGYMIDVAYSDGTKEQKGGSVSLLR